MTRDEAARRAAREVWSDGNDEIDIDTQPPVTHLDEGSAWVQAWVFVPAELIEERLKA